MMTKKDDILSVIEAILWYVFIYLFIYTIKHEVNLFLMSFILLVLIYAASVSCPIMRNTDAWIRLFGKNR